LHVLYVALASASELEYYSIVMADLEFLKRAEAAQIGGDAAEVKRMLTGLIASLRANATERLRAES
jgi:four helix bundle protein